MKEELRKHLQKEKRKNRILKTVATVAIITCTLASMKLAGFSASNFLNLSSNKIQGDNKTVRLENTSTITYIYDAQDLVNFRDSVNAGDTYEGKTVYLMDDIDLSTVCGKSVDTDGDGTGDTEVSWTPIGTTTTNFAGTFDGNYHTISNLYYYSSEKINFGFFKTIDTTAIVKNVLMDNVQITNTYDIPAYGSTIGTIIGISKGTMENCGVKNGNISLIKKNINTNTNSWPFSQAGGIVGENNSGNIQNCFNDANVSLTIPNASTYQQGFAGGIVGLNAEESTVENCYNNGKISTIAGLGEAGGIVGRDVGTNSVNKIINCYNTGSTTAKGNGESGEYARTAGIMGTCRPLNQPYGGYYNWTTPSNCYSVGTSYLYTYFQTDTAIYKTSTGIIEGV